MSRASHIGVAVVVAALSACPSPKPPDQAATRRATTRVDFDSATIDTLCVHPDSVRAGLADCVLKNQAPPGRRRLP